MPDLFEDDSFSNRRRQGSGTGRARGSLSSTVTTTPMATPGYQPNGGDTSEPEPGGGQWFTPPNGNTGVSGYAPGGVPMPSGGVQTAPRFNASNPDEYIRGMLGSTQYGAAGLKSLKDRMAQDHYNVWTDNNGGARGIITDPMGRDWNVLDRGESMNWWNNPTGSAWDPRIEQRGGGASSSGDSSALLSTIQQMLAGMNSPAPAPAPAPQPLDLSSLIPPQQAPNVSQASALRPAMLLQNPGLARALSTLSMQLPQLMRTQPNNPLVQQLMALLGA